MPGNKKERREESILKRNEPGGERKVKRSRGANISPERGKRITTD